MAKRGGFQGPHNHPAAVWMSSKGLEISSFPPDWKRFKYRSSLLCCLHILSKEFFSFDDDITQIFASFIVIVLRIYMNTDLEKICSYFLLFTIKVTDTLLKEKGSDLSSL